VVADCAGSTDNCPAGLHCAGTCQTDDPAIVHCTGKLDCTTAGGPNLVCARGVCVKRHRGGKGRRTTTTIASVTTTSTGGGTTTTTTRPRNGCADFSDCRGAFACCSGQCVEDQYANMGICSTVFTPECRVCRDDEDCECSAIDENVCDTCRGKASLSGCVDPCEDD